MGNDRTSLGPCRKPSGIEFLDMTGPPPEEPLHPFYAPAPDLDHTERNAEDTSNGVNTTRARSRSGGEEDGDIPPVEELLFSAGEAQKWQQIGSSDGHVTGGSEGNFKHTTEGDRNSAASPRSGEGEHKEKSVAVGDGLAEDRDTQDTQRDACGNTGASMNDDLTADRGKEREAVHLDKSIMAMDSDDSDAYAAVQRKPKPKFKHPKDRNNRASSPRKEPGSPGDPILVEDKDTDSSGDGTLEEQVGNQGSLRTSPTSVGGSESRSRSLKLHKKSEYDTPNTSPPYRNTSSTLGKRTCGSKGRDCEGLTPDLLIGRDKKNPRNGQEAEADNKRDHQERYNRDGNKKTLPLLGSTKKGCPSAVKEKSASKRRVKRRRCLSPERDEVVGSQDNILTVQDQDLDTQTDSTSPKLKSVKPKLPHASITHNPAYGTATSLPTLKQAQGRCDAAQAEGQEEWEIVRIVGKRRRGKDYEYKVCWKRTWLLGRELGNAQEVLREFEANRQAQRGGK